MLNLGGGFGRCECVMRKNSPISGRAVCKPGRTLAKRAALRGSRLASRQFSAPSHIRPASSRRTFITSPEVLCYGRYAVLKPRSVGACDDSI